MSRKKTTEEFIRDARKVHGNRYEYPNAEYTGVFNILIITCLIHGDFPQTAHIHLSGSGCPHCTGNARLNDIEFLKRAREVHGDRYGYSKSIYINTKTNLIITCKIHGDFQQTPDSHLGGSGCITCSGTERSNNEKFIQKARLVHGDRYGYDNVVYVAQDKKVMITCYVHGDFPQTPNAHIKSGKGSGCPMCKNRGFNYLTYAEAKKIIQPLGLRTKQEYYNWWDANKDYAQKIGLPKNPQEYYATHK